jgi:hypothetical protein
MALALITVNWSLFKMLYPYPNLIFDSYNYIKAAALDLSINSWPIGYSKFLQVFNLFSRSANLLVTFQYLFVELSCLFFFFTWLYLFKPGKLITNFLFILLFLNPLLLYCSNYILSDALFIGLSVLWITQLFWIICRPRPYMIFTHALLLALAFTIRYNALYYPIVAALAFALSRQGLWLKVAGISLPLALLTWFIIFTSGQAAKVTGERQFSAFGSWKLANDALYGYAHVIPGNNDPVPEKFRELDSTVRRYFRVTANKGDLLEIDYTSGSYFMFSLSSPLVMYMNNKYDDDWPFLNTKKWLTVAPLYQSYGAYLIKKYPAAFSQYFLWPNFIRYSLPQSEIFGSDIPFNWHESYGGVYVRKLFDLKTISIKESAVNLSTTILFMYPALFAIIHLGFIFGWLGFLFCRGFSKLKRPWSYCILLVAVLWCCDFGFSIVSAGIVLRYQIFMIIMETAFGLYLIEYAYKGLASEVLNGSSLTPA